MRTSRYVHYGRLYALFVIYFLCDLCESRMDITTLSTREINTRFVGTAYVTEFASEKFVTARFLGISYAKVHQRFAKPALNVPKPGVVEAKTFGNICPQVLSPGDPCQKQTMSEECLFLNIYVPLHNISNQTLSEIIKSASSDSIASSTLPTVSTLNLNGSLEESPSSMDNASAPEASNTASKVTFSSVKNILAQMERLEKTLLTDLKAENNTEGLWNTVKVTMKRSASPAGTHEKPLVLPANKKYAVLVYLHGGAYVMGSGNCYDGSVLAGHGNIIVVTVNYRLGNLGFLSTNDEVIPGNLGLWDQHVAIQWLKKYIHIFGGDPDRITLGGQSAGSYSSIYQALYQGNDGLFQRVIAQSGTPTAVKSASVTGYNTTLRVAQQLNCEKNTTKQQVKACLMSVSAEALVNVSLPMLVPGSLPIEPTVEEPFVTEDPYKVLSQMAAPGVRKPSAVPGYFTNKDLLIGLDAQDGDVALKMHAVLSSRNNSSKFHELMQLTIKPELFKNFVRMYFQHHCNENVDEYIINSVLDRYIDWKHPKDFISQSNRVIDFLTDVFFAIPVMETASAHCHQRPHNLTNQHETTTKAAPPLSESTTESPVTPGGGTFVYRFNLPEPKKSAIPWFRGTGHASEVGYVFGDPRLRDEPDVALSKNVMTYWSNFVKSGNPNRESPAGTTASPPRTNAIPLWPEYDNDNEYFMELSDKPETKSRMRADYRHFWTKYLPELKQHMQEVFNEGKQSALDVNHLKPESSGQAMSDSNIFVCVILAGIGMALVAM